MRVDISKAERQPGRRLTDLASVQPGHVEALRIWNHPAQSVISAGGTPGGLGVGWPAAWRRPGQLQRRVPEHVGHPADQQPVVPADLVRLGGAGSTMRRGRTGRGCGQSVDETVLGQRAR